MCSLWAVYNQHVERRVFTPHSTLLQYSFYFPFIIVECPSGCKDNLCDINNGVCINCNDGYWGRDCKAGIKHLTITPLTLVAFYKLASHYFI